MSRRDPVDGAWYDDRVRALSPFAVAVVVAAVVGVVGCDDCRAVETRALDLDCQGVAFRGEIHLDTADTWRSFLRDRCIPTAEAARIDALVAEVDFAVDAVVVASGARLSTTRCLQTREAESVDACVDGLRIVFDDVEIGPEDCDGTNWTVALLVPRGELRAALAANEDDITSVDSF